MCNFIIFRNGCFDLLNDRKGKNIMSETSKLLVNMCAYIDGSTSLVANMAIDLINLNC